MKRGLFIVFEGIDGAGTRTQAERLSDHLKNTYEGLDLELTREPWDDQNITRKIAKDKSAYSDAKLMTSLFITDRINHSKIVIYPTISRGGIVISDRYKMSTCAYQHAQGVDLEELLKMQENKGILTPDLTIFLDVQREVASQRVRDRILKENITSNIEDNLEKFERDPRFTDKVIGNYRYLVQKAQSDINLFGRVVKIDGNKNIETVSLEVIDLFNLLTVGREFY